VFCADDIQTIVREEPVNREIERLPATDCLVQAL
jgi:hypothetical protein